MIDEGPHGWSRPAPSDAETPRLLVLFAAGEDHRQVVGYLESHYDVATSRSIEALDSAFDCCLVDAETFARHHERLAALRDRLPTTPPVLLVASGDRLDHSGAAVWRRADEVVTTPVRQAELRARIDGLVERHDLVCRVARSESRFRTLFQVAPDPVLLFDDEGVLRDANQAFCEATGRDREACLGTELAALDVFADDSAERLGSAVGGDAESVDRVSYRSPDGTVRLANARVSRMPLESDRARHVVVLRDVTERVNRTRELRRQNERLDQFAQILAHELRNPLNVAEGNLDLVRDALEDAPALDRVERVERAHRRMGQMISELLELSRQGDVIGSTSTADFETVAREAWDRTPTPDATLVVDADGGSITADVDRVGGIFGNLFRNAVEHGRSETDDDAEHAGPDVTVRVGLLPDGSGFYVEDDGPGIPPAERDAVLDAGYTTAADGTGFGLAIVDQIATAHGWTVAVGSSADGGARFEITGLSGASADPPE